jgi:hypothetical protein
MVWARVRVKVRVRVRSRVRVEFRVRDRVMRRRWGAVVRARRSRGLELGWDLR